MFKRIFAAVLCGTLAASAFTACGAQKSLDVGSSAKTDSTDDEEDEDDTKAPGDNSSGSGKERGSEEGSGSEETSGEAVTASSGEAANYDAPQKGDKVIVMDIKDYGEVKIRLFPEYAPEGVENFIGLAEQGYYDGLTFHRVIKDFMIQGGDPLGTGMGGESIWGGSFDGGTDPHLIHVAGALAYANSGSTKTDGSQFYIVTGTTYTADEVDSMDYYYGSSHTDAQKALYEAYGGAPWLDGGYTVFGQVYDGLDVVFEVQNVTVDTGNAMPMTPVIIESVKVAEYDGEELKYYISDYD